MIQVFVDTAAWIAILNEDDMLHTAAVQKMGNLLRQRIPLVTTEFVLLEVADALSNPTFREQTVSFIHDCWNSEILEVIPASHALIVEGLELFRQRPDKDWSLTDCISFVVMSSQEITQALTSDRHFQQAGFIKLLV